MRKIVSIIFALAVLQGALAFAQGNKSDQLNQAVEAYNANNLAQAAKLFYDVKMSDPQAGNRAQAEYYLAQSLFKMGMYQSALAFYNAVFVAGPAHPYYIKGAEGLVNVAQALHDDTLIPSQINKYYNSQEFAKMDDGRRVMDILFEDSDLTTFQFEPDLYWVAHGGGSPVAWLKKLAGRCDVIHLKDFAIKADRTQYYTEIGEGNLDWPTIMATVEQIGVKWMPVEQDTCPGNPFDSLALSYQNLSSWGYR